MIAVSARGPIIAGGLADSAGTTADQSTEKNGGFGLAALRRERSHAAPEPKAGGKGRMGIPRGRAGMSALTALVLALAVLILAARLERE